jgi:pyruvate dehydrogenase E2 component (dihydrolipoamide acetyltransferase)
MLPNNYVENETMNNPETTNAYQVVMPRLGLTMREGKIIEWYKKDGDFVTKGEPLFSIENEKASLDIESPASGLLQIQIPVDVSVPILSPVALLLGSGQASGHHAIADVTVIKVEKNKLTENQDIETVITQNSDKSTVRATPKARVIARRDGVDLSNLTGSGVRGMVVSADVFQKIKTIVEVRATPLAKLKAADAGIDLHGKTGSGPRGMVRCEDLARFSNESLAANIPCVKPLSELRTIISNRLGQSWLERPQVTLTTEADATLFMEARKQLNFELGKKNVKISLNALFIKIAAQAILEFPYINVSLIPEGLLQHQDINIGLAVDTERGLLVPVLRYANSKSFESIQIELDGLVDRTLSGKNLKDELSGGTFTITNLGTYEIDAFTPIINPPECAILGIGRIIQKPVAYEGQIVLRNMVNLSLSFDHRLVDGAPAAKFLQRIKQYLEQPFLWSLWKNNQS